LTRKPNFSGDLEKSLGHVLEIHFAAGSRQEKPSKKRQEPNQPKHMINRVVALSFLLFA